MVKIAVAQIKPIKGDIPSNVLQHVDFIELAAVNQVDLLIFPELSLTGYEPELAQHLAIFTDDAQLDVIQKLSDHYNLSIALGIPTRSANNYQHIFISTVVFQPTKLRLFYSKQNLYKNEKQIFQVGQDPLYLHLKNETVAFAICYDLSHPLHAVQAKKDGADIYMVSVLNSVQGLDSDVLKLSQIAKNHQMTVAMANFIGTSGGYECAGKSSIWNNSGELVGQLTADKEGLLIYDTHSRQVVST